MAAIVMSGVQLKRNVSDVEVERRARNLGMEYPSEFKVINKEESK